MTAVATIRVKALEEGAGSAPERALVEAAANLLRSHGFDVRRMGRFGVSVAGDEDTFRRELGVSVTPGQAQSVEPTVRDARLAELIDLVEVVSTPTSF